MYFLTLYFQILFIKLILSSQIQKTILFEITQQIYKLNRNLFFNKKNENNPNYTFDFELNYICMISFDDVSQMRFMTMNWRHIRIKWILKQKINRMKAKTNSYDILNHICTNSIDFTIYKIIYVLFERKKIYQKNLKIFFFHITYSLDTNKHIYMIPVCPIIIQRSDKQMMNICRMNIQYYIIFAIFKKWLAKYVLSMITFQ